MKGNLGINYVRIGDRFFGELSEKEKYVLFHAARILLEILVPQYDQLLAKTTEPNSNSESSNEQ